uniref:Uncharacterized protein n=1 Tax=Caenorhabditis japonica TaxID=281687 RepID=A0A8R1HJW6_CAEJA
MAPRPRKVQWADEDEHLPKTQKLNNAEYAKTKKLVQVRSYSGYAETFADEKTVQTSPAPRRTAQKFDRNLSTVHEEKDDDPDV